MPGSDASGLLLGVLDRAGRRDDSGDVGRRDLNDHGLPSVGQDDVKLRLDARRHLPGSWGGPGEKVLVLFSKPSL